MGDERQVTQPPVAGPERVGQVLQRLGIPPRRTDQEALKMLGELTPPGPQSKEVCPLCLGGKWVSHRVPVGHPDFGKAFPCSCALEELAKTFKERLLAWAELPAGLQRLTFEGLVPTLANEAAKGAAFAFARGELEEKWLVLSGGAGLAKTHLGVAVLLWRVEHREDGCELGKYVNLPDFLDDLRAGFKDDSYEERFDRYRQVGLLLLDDLGAQQGTAWAWEKLYQLLDHRSRERMETIITTNLRPEALPPRIADRIMDTGTGLCRLVVVQGPSYRSGREW